MDDDDNVYRLEHSGLLNVDKLLSAFCAGLIPAILAFFAKGAIIPVDAKFWVRLLIIFDIPAIFCLLWHSFRWPVRMHWLEKNNLKAYKAFSNDLIHILDNVVTPKMHEAVFGKDNSRIIKGADGKEYVPGPPEDIKERIIKSLRDNFSSDNPLIDNAITANSTKIYKANRSSMVGLLPERFPRTKQIIDCFARFFRYPLIAAVIFCAVKCALVFIQ